MPDVTMAWDPFSSALMLTLGIVFVVGVIEGVRKK